MNRSDGSIRLRGLALAAASGALLSAAFSHVGLWWLGWCALVPLVAALRRGRPLAAFLYGLCAGAMMTAWVLYYIPGAVAMLGRPYALGLAAVAVGALYGGCYTGLWAMCTARFLQSFDPPGETQGTRWWAVLLLAPSAWVMMEFIHSRLFPGIPYTFIFLGLTQWRLPPVIQIADLASVYGVSFVVVLVNAGIALGIARRDYRPAVAAAGVVMLCLAYGVWRISSWDAGEREEKIRVAILQGNIGATMKMDASQEDALRNRYVSLNAEAVKENPDLVIWTETAIPWRLREGDNWLEECLRITSPSGAAHLVGTPSLSPRPGLYYNSVYFVEPDGLIIPDSYRKVRLLSFVELPFPDTRSPVLEDAGDTRWAYYYYYTGAEEQTVLDTSRGRIGVSLCNENAYPELIRGCAEKGAEFLVNVANNAWGPGRRAIMCHFIENVFRAVENKRYVAVAANVGISAVIDGCGRIRMRSEILKACCPVGEIERRSDFSLYPVVGDLFCWLCALTAIGGVAASFKK